MIVIYSLIKVKYHLAFQISQYENASREYD